MTPYKPIGTIARMWADSVSSKYLDCLMDLRAYSERYLCGPGEHIAYKRATVSWHEGGRNELAREFEGDWVLMLDTDHQFAPDLLERMLRLARRENLRFLSGIYQYKFPPHGPVAGCWGPDGTLQPLLDWNRDRALIDVSVVGGGCLLIFREVFDKIRKELKEDPFSIMPRLSEDYSFCKRLESIGVPVKLATTIECHHVIPTVLSVRDYNPGLWKPTEPGSVEVIYKPLPGTELLEEDHDAKNDVTSAPDERHGGILSLTTGEATPGVVPVRGTNESVGTGPTWRPLQCEGNGTPCEG